MGAFFIGRILDGFSPIETSEKLQNAWSGVYLWWRRGESNTSRRRSELGKRKVIGLAVFRSIMYTVVDIHDLTPFLGGR